MHVHFEQNTYTRTDSSFHSLSWMGKVPDSLPDEGWGWKLNRAQYYSEGWLASGNGKGIVGITFTTSHCQKYEAPPRSNFNLRGHRSEVILVKWNEPYQRLATCDSRGVIFVWIKHEGRWSIELINDRNSQVTDFAWSHDGRMALICYRDGFVLVGSVAGQRFWSSMLNLDSTAITCGIWSPDDQEVMFGTTDGQVIVMSSAGAMIRQFVVNEGNEITAMAWSCEKFNMEEADSKESDSTHKDEEDSSVLAICFKYGDIYLLSSYDDVCPCTVHTSLQGLKMDWSNCGQYLAVGGFMRLPNLQCHNELHFYTREGRRIHHVPVPSQGKPLTAITWGHNDKRIFLAAGCQLYVAWVSKQVAPLNFLCNRVVSRCVRSERNVDFLPLPQRLRQAVQSLFSPTVKSYIPDPFKLRGFVSTPPPGNERLFCTMIRHGDETSGGHYTLYLEYLGGLVPLLKGKRASKLRPDFVIFDPKIRTSGKSQRDPNSLQTDSSSESDNDVVTDGCGSPRMQRRRRQKVFRAEKVERSITFRTLDELLYNDNLPETNKLIEVTSNIWGTKFQITGVASYLPSMLGTVVYKTSLLHLQPRQMTITLQEICGSSQPLARDPNFTAAGVSDEEEDSSWPLEVESQDLPAPSQPPIDSWGELSSSNVCCVDVQTSNVVSLTPVHQAGVSNNNNNSNVVSNHNAINSGASEIDSISSLYVNGSDSNGSSSSGSVGSSSGGTSNGSGGNSGGVGISCVGNSLASKLSASGSIRTRSLSPVQDSSTQTSTMAFNGDLDLLTNSHAKDIYAAQGARPKVKKGSQPKRPNSVRTLPSPTTGNNISHTSYANGTVTGFSSPFPASTVVTATATISSSASSKAVAADLPDLDVTSVMHAAALTCSPVSPEPEVAGMLKRISGGAGTDGGSGSMGGPGSGRWADPATTPIKYVAEEAVQDSSELPYENNLVADCSSSAPSSVVLQRRLYLAQTLPDGDGWGDSSTSQTHSEDSSLGEPGARLLMLDTGLKGLGECVSEEPGSDNVSQVGKAHFGVDCQGVRTGDSEKLGSSVNTSTNDIVTARSSSGPPYSPNHHSSNNGTIETSSGINATNTSFTSKSSSISSQLYTTISSAGVGGNLLSNGVCSLGDIEILHSTSLPSSPIHGASKAETPTRRMREEVMKGKCRHLSPLLRRKGKHSDGGCGGGVGGSGGTAGLGLDHLDEDLVLLVEDFKGGQSYHNLETFQKSQLKHKLRRAQGMCGGQFVMHNKAPLWNENSQVYQLDFGGRVTQESAKNFQIELQGKQVMQFGRIDSNAYTLDFQYPFTALQAFAVALANVTQRLK